MDFLQENAAVFLKKTKFVEYYLFKLKHKSGEIRKVSCLKQT